MPNDVSTAPSRDEERLLLFTVAVRDARANLAADMHAARQDPAEPEARIEQVKTNLRRHRTNLNNAFASQLEKNSQTVTELTQAAKDEVERMKKARTEAQNIVKLIQQSSSLADALGKLVTELKK